MKIKNKNKKIKSLSHCVEHLKLTQLCKSIILQLKKSNMGFPDSSVGKESACNAGDLVSGPGLGRSPGEGLGYSLQYSWASLVAQLIKNLPEMLKTWAQSLGWEDPLKKGKVTHSSILAWRIPWTAQSMELQSGTRLSDFHFQKVQCHCK